MTLPAPISSPFSVRTTGSCSPTRCWAGPSSPPCARGYATASRAEIDPAAIRTPVLLWYGDEDLMAPPVHGHWLNEHLLDARLVMRTGEGHLGILEHLPEMLSELVAG
jgi:pimeloyl-ACP methyl ester carboxylesterase